MIKSCVTISLVPETRGGPFVFWDDLASCSERAKQLGFDAVEIFAPSPAALSPLQLRSCLEENGLRLGAVGTGAGWLLHRLSLVDRDAGRRVDAMAFVRSMIDLGGPHGAPAIVGSMQGRWGDEIDRSTALAYLADGLNELGDYARQYRVPLLYEPLNRYETNLINSMADGVKLLKPLSSGNVKLLADLFHMNIEEADLAAAIRDSVGYLGHVHFVDSNRQAAGRGHLDFEPIAAALNEIRYDGYASAEALPIPDSETAARQTIQSFRKYFKS